MFVGASKSPAMLPVEVFVTTQKEFINSSHVSDIVKFIFEILLAIVLFHETARPDDKLPESNSL